MKLLALSVVLRFLLVLESMVGAELESDLYFYDEDHHKSSLLQQYQCTFEGGDPCDFELVEPPARTPVDEDALRWYRRQAVIMSNGDILYDHTKGVVGGDGTLLFASGGSAGSVTAIETATDSRCSSTHCCLNAFVLMSQAQSSKAKGSLAFYVIQDLPGSNTDLFTTTILANISFTSYGNFWTNIQRTFPSNSKPFHIGIEGRNGDGGVDFFVAVDDITVTNGICETDKKLLGDSPGVCGPPPDVVAAEMKTTSRGTANPVGTFVLYSCMLGYDMMGPSNITCLPEGRWSTPPLCVPYYRYPYIQPRVFGTGVHDPLHEIQAEEQVLANSFMASSKIKTDCIWGENLAEDTPQSALVPATSKLILFPDNPFTCPGKLVRWVFLSAPADDGTPVYLSVWRPVTPGSTRQYRLVGKNQFTSRISQPTIQFSVPGTDRIEVQAGDIVGIIHKVTSSQGIVQMHDPSHLRPGMRSASLYTAVTDDRYIEDIAKQQDRVVVTIDRSTQRRLLPALQAYVGESDCSEQIWEGVTFTGLNTIIPEPNSEETCWDYCRNQPPCFAVTFNPDTNDCIAYSYISTEVHSSGNNRSMVKLCQSDCDTKMLSSGPSFDVAFQGALLPLDPGFGQSSADCELACRYTPACVAFTYANPFEPGSCRLFSNTTRLISQTNRRSFRKWGCSDVNRVDDCAECKASIQCSKGSKCLAPNGDYTLKCIPPSGPRACVKKPQCPEPPSISNGFFSTQDYGDMQVATYACNSGYELSGGAQISCNGGIWQTPVPNCQAQCPPLPPVENGQVDDMTPGSTSNKQALVTCNRGYRLVGRNIIACNGGIGSEWYTIPSCVPNCGNPPNVQNAQITILQGNQANPTTVRYDCDSGYSLSGANTLRCSNGDWIPSPPTCQLIPPACPAVPQIRNGMVVDQGAMQGANGDRFAIYNCNSGFNLIGNSMVRCISGIWRSPLPVCQPACPKPPSVENGQVTELTVETSADRMATVRCNRGYRLVGSSTITCSPSTVASLGWAPVPQCAPDCGLPPYVANARWTVTQGSQTVPTVVRYDCTNGYTLIGTATLRCPSGSWTPDAPSCQQIPSGECPPVPSLVNGAVCESGSLARSPDSKYAVYKCVSGYQLVGNPKIFCLSGRWQWDRPPYCTALCDPVPSIPNAMTRIISIRSGQPIVAQYGCLDGFEMQGEPVVSCVSSMWSRLPKCVNIARPPTYCGPPPVISFGAWRPVSYLGNVPITVEYGCNEGYALNGPNRLNCLRPGSQGGSWSWQPSSVPVCRPCDASPPVFVSQTPRVQYIAPFVMTHQPRPPHSIALPPPVTPIGYSQLGMGGNRFGNSLGYFQQSGPPTYAAAGPDGYGAVIGTGSIGFGSQNNLIGGRIGDGSFIRTNNNVPGTSLGIQSAPAFANDLVASALGNSQFSRPIYTGNFRSGNAFQVPDEPVSILRTVDGRGVGSGGASAGPYGSYSGGGTYAGYGVALDQAPWL